MRTKLFIAALLCSIVMIGARATVAQTISEKTISVVDHAMADELARAKSNLHLQGLIDPFFISYTVADQDKLEIQASNGSISRSDEARKRVENVRLLVNNYQFNDENFEDNTGFFSFNTAPDNTLPLDDDYLGIRRALWLSTDDLFKEANENFTKKKAAYEHKQLDSSIKDLPDFSKVGAVQIEEAPSNVHVDRAQLEALAKKLSGIFSAYPGIESSQVSLDVLNSYEWIQNTEGTKVRKPVTFCEITAEASTQAKSDGEPLTLSFHAVAKVPDELPSESELSSRVTKLATDLTSLSTAPLMDQEYTGPVMFEDGAAANFIAENVISRLVAKREDALGNDVSAIFSSGKSSSLKEKIGTRILPSSANVTDLSLTKSKDGVDLLGYYPFDDEGVAPTESLDLVQNGILKTLYMTRTPTKEVREPNGHARSFATAMPGVGENAPAPGVVEYRDSKTLATAEMEKDLIKRAKEDGYTYGLVVRSIQSGLPIGEDAGFSLQDMLANGKSIIPSLIYKVYADGHEELVRGAEIGLPTVRDLREIISSNETATRNLLISAGSGGLFSFSSKVAASLIGPENILCPELEVGKKKPEAYPTQPVVARP